VFDHRTDSPVTAPVEEVPVAAVVIVEGMFLHRDGGHPDPEHPSMRRYVAGQRTYLATCRPRERATVVLDNS
jgi:uridine kinase